MPLCHGVEGGSSYNGVKGEMPQKYYLECIEYLHPSEKEKLEIREAQRKIVLIIDPSTKISNYIEMFSYAWFPKYWTHKLFSINTHNGDTRLSSASKMYKGYQK